MNKKILILALLIITVLLIAGCIQKPKPTTTTIKPVECGNGICELEENGNNCQKDCCVSGDGKCLIGCAPANDNDCKIGCEMSITCEEGYIPHNTGEIDAQGCPVRKCIKEEVAEPVAFSLPHFGAQLTFSSSDMFIGIDELKEQLKVIEETGADVIRIDMDYEAWMTNNQDNIKRHDEIIKQIKNDGKSLMLADRGAISFKKNKVTWDYFREQHLKHTRIFMEKYKPDYFVVVKEPIWYYKFYSMISTNTTPEMWRDLASEACTIVKEVNPETKCAVAVYASGEREKEFFALAANIANLDIMGVDVYDDKDIQATTNELIPLVPQDKELWMLESWNGGASSYLQPWKEDEDAEWINKSVRFAQKNNFSGYIVYYPVHFSSYTKLRGIDWSKRTKPFYAYESVIEEIRNNVK